MIWGNYSELLNAAISCHEVTSLSVTFPFLSFKLPSHLKRIQLSLSDEVGSTWGSVYTNTGISTYLSCQADYCRAPSVQSLDLYTGGYKFEYSLPPRMYCNFLSILNHSFHCNSAIKRLKLRFCDFEPLRHSSVLSQALQKDPNMLLSKNRRSNSLCDLATPDLVTRERSVFSLYEKSHSCPDLLELQSLRTLHPLLDEQLYYTRHQHHLHQHNIRQILEHNSYLKQLWKKLSPYLAQR